MNIHEGSRQISAETDGDSNPIASALEAALETATSEEHRAAITALEFAIADATRTPEALESVPPELLLRARVILIRLYLAEGDEIHAREAMDTLIFVDQQEQAPVRAFGREVASLYDERRAALREAGEATLHVDCAVDCEIILDERRVEGREHDLPPGTHRIWIRARDEPVPWSLHEVALGQAGSVERIAYADPSPPPVLDLPPPPPPLPYRRIHHRAAEITELAVGVALVGLGATLLALDGKCSKTLERPTSTTTKEACGLTFYTLAGGLPLTAVGGGILLVSGILLTVDEVRIGRNKGVQATAGVTLRF